MKSKSSQLVSIIIPTYNHASYLDRALRCVLDQTYENWEAIVIDNYSTDNTQEIISKYKDKRVKYLKIRNNGIIAKSRNKGILASKGNWIAFLDSDDWWIPRKLELCMKYINNNDLIYHDLKIKYSNRRNLLNRIVKTRKLKKPILIDLLVNGNAICNSSVIVKKQILQKIGLIDESYDLVASEDYNAWIRISSLTDKFLYLPKKLGYYFIHNQSVSKKNTSTSFRKATVEFLSLLNKEQRLKLNANIKYFSARFNYLNNNYAKARGDLIFVLKKGFFHLRLRAIYILLMMILKK